MFVFLKAFPWIIFSIPFSKPIDRVVDEKKYKTEFVFSAFIFESNFALIQGYLNPALKNPALSTTLSRPTISYLRFCEQINRLTAARRTIAVENKKMKIRCTTECAEGNL